MDNTQESNLIESGDSTLSEPSTKTPKIKEWCLAIIVMVEVKENGKLVPKNKCGICKTLFEAGSSAGTSHLRRHVKNSWKGTDAIKFWCCWKFYNFCLW